MSEMAEENKMIDEITLKNGQKVKISTKLSLAEMKIARSEGLISDTLIADMLQLEKDPTKMNFEDMENAPFIAYRNANPNGMSREEFEVLVPYDVDLFGQVYAGIISGEAHKKQMAENFKKATNNKKKKPKRSYQK